MVGERPKPFGEARDSLSTIQDTKRYLEDFDRLQKTATSDQGLFDQMTELYPDWVANQSWLVFGFPGALTRINRGGRSSGTFRRSRGR
jgi:hypothetical protein